MDDGEVKALRIFFSFGGIGYFPFAQGTLASAFACSIYYLSSHYLSVKSVIFYTLPLLVLSLVFAPYIPKLWKESDPHQVVIDEVIGMFISLILLPPDFKHIILAFFLFRFLDVLKVPPISFLDRMENPYAVILDDILAGIITNILIRIIMLAFDVL